MAEEIVNRVTSSSLISIDLEEYIDHSDSVTIDMKGFLVQGVLLREKDFRQQVKENRLGSL